MSFFARLTTKQKDEILTQVAKESARRFQVYKDTMKEYLGYYKLPDEEKLAMLRARGEEQWARIQAYSPKLYDEQISEWQIMEERSMHRALSAWNPFNAKSSAPVNE